MDGSVLEHSDSDSGESWTILDNTPSYCEDDLPCIQQGETAENIDKDEDTDGISIISDSDPESPLPCEIGTYERCLLDDSRSADIQIPEFVSINPVPTNNNNEHHESIRSKQDFVGDNTGKLKTYVHRRNKRLSTMLNIIVLGSVITAAGVAIGHMWGARNECSMHSVPSVNKILSNLYKLQEENAYLRNKIKELTLVNNMQINQRKTDPEKVPFKQNRCKKMFEEPLNNKNADRVTKCLDNDNAMRELESHLKESDQEKEYLNDITKLKNIYQQNKSWLDDEIARRMKLEEVHKIKNNLKSPKSIKINEENSIKYESLNKPLEPINELPVKAETVLNVTEPLIETGLNTNEEAAAESTVPEKIITYADSLRSVHKIKKRDTKDSFVEYKHKDYARRKKPRKDDVISETLVSDDDMKKDDRYMEHKLKPDRKNKDHHKIHKKQKRRNKYEQWEMKGGYMKDYDDFSISSLQGNEHILKNPNVKPMNSNFERNNHINQFIEIDANVKSNDAINIDNKFIIEKLNKGIGKGNKEKDMSWFEKRAALRNDARKKLEQELFGDSTPNNAGWYFRRMQRREQCRLKGDNSTYRKLSKRIMNFKTKH